MDKLFYMQDVHGGDAEAFFNQLSEKNSILYGLIIGSLEKGSSVGIRKEVISYFADKAEELGNDSSFLFHLVDFSCNPKMTAEHICFVVDFFDHNPDKKIAIDDFSVIFSACVEKDISLDEMRQLLYSNRDIVDIYEVVENHIAAPGKPDEDALPKENASVIVGGEIPMAGAADNRNNEYWKAGPADSDADLFSNLITVVTYQDKDEDGIINESQDCFSGIISKIQNITSDVSAFSSELMNSMKRDKEEIKKLKAMITIIQKLLSSKQNEINELRGQVERLKERICSAELADQRRSALNQKISEAYKLTINSDGMDMEYLP